MMILKNRQQTFVRMQILHLISIDIDKSLGGINLYNNATNRDCNVAQHVANGANN